RGRHGDLPSARPRADGSDPRPARDGVAEAAGRPADLARADAARAAVDSGLGLGPGLRSEAAEARSAAHGAGPAGHENPGRRGAARFARARGCGYALEPVALRADGARSDGVSEVNSASVKGQAL